MHHISCKLLQISWPLSSCKMAARSDITPIAILKPEMYRRRIKGRITKLWTAHSATDGKKISHDFIFVDKENTAIEGFIRISDEDNILQQVQEGLVYEFYKFIPTIKREVFRTVEHGARIQLTGATIITNVENDDAAFPLRYFNFKPLNSIGTTITGDKTVVDVIGQVVFIGPIKRVNKNSGQVSLRENSGQVSLREIEIEDERDDKVLITIWEEHLPQIDFQKIEEESKTQEIILAFSSLRLLPFKEKWNLTTYSATRIYQDQFLPEITTFRRRIAKNNKQLTLHEATPLEEQPDEQLPPSVSIKELHDMCIPENQDKSFNVVAKISDTLEELGWYYEACPIHRTKVRQPSYFCYKCKANVRRPLPWLNFRLIVADETGDAQFSFIGKQAEYLIGSSAQDLLYCSNNQGKKKHLPPVFAQLNNKEHMFTVQWEKNKFTDDTIYYHVTDIQNVPPATTKQISAAAATPYEKNR
ncbi:replication protein A DNA-binding subunit D-like isoform X2 [Carex littledalei]|uniref:Replication protein A DNA-binding subunit D-like isoform X2 n=1 Tax=Carex littledalei TaxID=544730 RepID=A0A833R8F0_9POAL|nr:replication protein A DNA-binding subunit D-like isoform X2 [Carex littledalei]